MKKFLKQICIFIVPLLIIAVIMELTLRQIPNDYEYKNSKIELKKDTIKTLILGSSHSMYSFNPEYFTDNAYNLGHVSQTIDLDYYLLKKYIKTLSKLQTVVLRLSYTTLHEQIEEGLESWRLKDYQLYYGLDVSNKLKYKSEILSVKLKNNISRLKDYYINNDKMIAVENSGWAFFKQNHTSDSIETVGLKTAKKHTIKSDDLVKENLEFLDEIMKICKANSINVILVTLPAHKSYIENLDDNQLEIVISAGQKMEKNYSNCHYLNLLSDSKFNDEDFYDADHLNKIGSKKLSVLVDSYISKSLN